MVVFYSGTLLAGLCWGNITDLIRVIPYNLQNRIGVDNLWRKIKL
jgi:hypothetical protein